MQPCLINCATTNKPSMTGPPPIHPSVAAKTGQNTNLLHWTLRTNTGFCLGPFCTPCCHLLLRSLRKAPFPIKSSHPRRSTWTNYIRVYANGPNEMVYHRCQPRRSRFLVTNCGKNTINTSHTTSPNPPSPSFKPLLKRQFSIVKTNKLHHFGSIARASTTKPSQIPFKTLQSLKQWGLIQPQQSLHSLPPSLNNMDNNTHGQLERDDSYQRATSWPNERRPFAVDDPSSRLWTRHFVPCSTSWLGWSSNSSQLLALTILPPEMYIIYSPS